MKTGKSNRLHRYMVVFSLILGVFAGVAIKLYQFEKTMNSENQDIEKYRKQNLQSEIETGENNIHSVKPYLDSLELVDIKSIQLTLLNISQRITLKSNDIISNEICKKTVLSEEEQGNCEDVITETDENHKFQDTEKIDTFQEMDCILKIPSIKLEKPVYNQNTKAYLQNFNLVTAYDNMNFNTGGTYIIYGHNSYVENLSFQSLPKIQFNDVIIIEYMNMDFEFQVTDIQRVNTEEISNYFVQEENKIVLVACTNQSTKTNPEYLVVTAKR